jgi:hypothetical protein
MDSDQNSCSILCMWKIFPLLWLATIAAAAAEQSTAYDALRVLGHEMGRDAVAHVISISGADGAPQPEKWKILLQDTSGSDAVQEVEIADGQIASERPPARAVTGSSEGATIDTRRLNLDSTGAYAVASHAAEKSGAQFATVTYTLRTDERGEPVWIVTLEDNSRRRIGTIYIGASRGNITRTEGLFAGVTMQDVETEGDSDDARGILRTAKSRISRSFHQAEVEARDFFERTKQSFTDFMNGD